MFYIYGKVHSRENTSGLVQQYDTTSKITEKLHALQINYILLLNVHPCIRDLTTALYVITTKTQKVQYLFHLGGVRNAE